MSNRSLASATVAPEGPESIAERVCKNAHNLAERADIIATALGSKLAPYSFPPCTGKGEPCPIESYPDYFHGLRIALDNISNALDRIALSTDQAQL